MSKIKLNNVSDILKVLELKNIKKIHDIEFSRNNNGDHLNCETNSLILHVEVKNRNELIKMNPMIENIVSNVHIEFEFKRVDKDDIDLLTKILSFSKQKVIVIDHEYVYSTLTMDQLRSSYIFEYLDPESRGFKELRYDGKLTCYNDVSKKLFVIVNNETKTHKESVYDVVSSYSNETRNGENLFKLSHRLFSKLPEIEKFFNVYGPYTAVMNNFKFQLERGTVTVIDNCYNITELYGAMIADMNVEEFKEFIEFANVEES